jgi:UDP-2,3-diacylglucosamine hydrolase
VTSWFLSDLHLKDSFERNGNILLRFLFELNQNPQEHRLFLLGDIFDVWVSDGSVFQDKFKIIIDEIVRLKKNGGQVYYFEGNHDVHIDIFWTKLHGIPVFEKAQYLDLDGLTVRIEHGDYINPNDKTYLKWLEMLRSSYMKFAGRNIPSHVWDMLARWYSTKSRKKTSRYSSEKSEDIRKLIRSYAESCFSEKPFDLIVTGHMHVFDFYELKKSDKLAQSVNLGTWLEKPRVLIIKDKKTKIIELE